MSFICKVWISKCDVLDTSHCEETSGQTQDLPEKLCLTATLGMFMFTFLSDKLEEVAIHIVSMWALVSGWHCWLAASIASVLSTGFEPGKDGTICMMAFHNWPDYSLVYVVQIQYVKNTTATVVWHKWVLTYSWTTSGILQLGHQMVVILCGIWTKCYCSGMEMRGRTRPDQGKDALEVTPSTRPQINSR